MPRRTIEWKNIIPENDILQYEWIIKSTIRRKSGLLKFTRVSKDDLIQEGWIAIIRALNKLPEDATEEHIRRYLFSSVNRRITQYVCKNRYTFSTTNYWKLATDIPIDFSIDAPVLSHSDGSHKDIDYSPIDIKGESDYRFIELVEDIKYAVKDTKKRDMWYLYNLYGLTMDQIGEIYGMTRQGVFQNLKKADNKIKEKIKP